eukprot:11166820-Lingulodinium_polyedra.AAC.1
MRRSAKPPHAVFRAGGLVFSDACGGFAERRMVRLARPCAGRVFPPGTEFRRVREGRHPRSGAWLGAPQLAAGR